MDCLFKMARSKTRDASWPGDNASSNELPQEKGEGPSVGLTPIDLSKRCSDILTIAGVQVQIQNLFIVDEQIKKAMDHSNQNLYLDNTLEVHYLNESLDFLLPDL